MRRQILLVCAAVVGLTAWGQEEKDALEGEVSESLASLRLANELVRYGYTHEKALPLVQALQIMAETPTQKLMADKNGETADPSQGNQKSSMVSFDAEQILSDAKTLAQGDEPVMQLIENYESYEPELTRGRVNGPARTIENVRANSTDIYQISFIEGYIAEILVCGDGDTDLDLYVYDSNGNLIASDTDYTDVCYVSWVPRWTGRFTVKVVNLGSVYNCYILLTN